MTDEVAINPADTQLPGFALLGEMFSAARNEKKLTLKDVSNKLRLSIKQIEALESNDFTSLPPAMITRGFIRNYARLLEIDAEPLLASYRTRIPEATPSTLNVKTSMHQVMPTSSRNQSSLKYILLASFIILAAASWYYYAHYMHKPALQVAEGESALNASESAAALPEIALPAAERQAEADGANAELALNYFL